jgi:small subunit ribosomal protein S27e
MIVKKHNIMIPKPRSHFVKVECDSCKNIKVLYTFGTKPISCPSCNAELLVNTGGQAKILGNILETLD